MIRNISQFSDWFVTENDRKKALVKYELNSLRITLRKCLEKSNKQKYYSDEVLLLCNSLANKYFDYLQLLDYKVTIHFSEVPLVKNLWSDHFNQIFTLEQKIARPLALKEEKELLIELINLYQGINKPTSTSMTEVQYYSKQLKQLFCEQRPDTWLLGIVEFWSMHDVTCIELETVLCGWDIQQQQKAFNYFVEPIFVNLVNAIFFYKLHPDKLFANLIHPEKLISIRMRLGVLHYSIELIQQKLYGISLQYGLKPAVDYLLHNEELPDGITIDACDQFKEMIQTAVKKLKVKNRSSKIKYVSCFHDLELAYKFGFNPNRLIDVIMLLREKLLSEILDQHFQPLIFREKMIALYRYLSTTECLNLYGYFANNDSRYLLCTFFTVAHGGTFDWLPVLNEEEKMAVIEVFDTLHSVMDALRIELKNRSMITNSYTYDLINPSVHIGHRNRDAVFRAITIYKRKKTDHSDTLEQLFRYMEEENHSV